MTSIQISLFLLTSMVTPLSTDSGWQGNQNQKSFASAGMKVNCFTASLKAIQWKISQTKHPILWGGMKSCKAQGKITMWVCRLKERALFWPLWAGHIYFAGMEYFHGYLPYFYVLLQYLCPIFRYQNEASSGFALEKLKTEMLLRSFLPLPLAASYPFLCRCCHHHLSSETEG